MSETTPLPADIPGTITLDQARAVVGAFGYTLVMLPAGPRPTPPGFAAEARS